MPRRCCVLKCNSNYDSTLAVSGPVSTFAFPKDPELSSLWLKSIARENFKVTRYTTVCAKHFKESEIVCFNEIGQVLKRVRLIKGAVPSVFAGPDCSELKPSNLYSRKALEQDKIKTFENFRDDFQSHLDSNDDWFFKINPDNVIFFLIESNETEICQFTIRISVSKELIVQVFAKNVQLTGVMLNSLLPKSKKLSLWSQFVKVLRRFHDWKSTSRSNRENHLKLALVNLEAAHEIDDGYEQAGKLQILINELKHLFTKKM